MPASSPPLHVLGVFLHDPSAVPLPVWAPGGVTLTHEGGQNNRHQMREALVERDAETLSDKVRQAEIDRVDCPPCPSPTRMSFSRPRRMSLNNGRSSKEALSPLKFIAWRPCVQEEPSRKPAEQKGERIFSAPKTSNTSI